MSHLWNTLIIVLVYLVCLKSLVTAWALLVYFYGLRTVTLDYLYTIKTGSFFAEKGKILELKQKKGTI